MMKKKTYQQPAIRVMDLRYQQLLTYSVIPPGKPNEPAAAPEQEALEDIWILE